METGMRVGTIARLTENEKQILHLYSELLSYSEKHRKHLNPNNDFAYGTQMGIDLCCDKTFNKIRKIMKV